MDHYHFRAALKAAPSTAPMTLQGPDAKAKWWQPYYDSKNILSSERTLLAG